MPRRPAHDFRALLGARDPDTLPVSVYKRGEGTSVRDWAGYVDFGPQGGKRVRKEFSAPTRKAVRAKIQAFVSDLKREARSSSEITVGDFFLHWLGTVKRPSVAPSTFARWESFRAAHLHPLLGSRRLADLCEDDLHAFFDQLRARGLSPNTVALVARPVLKLGLDYAVKGEAFPLSRSPLAGIPLSRGPTAARALRPEELRTLLRALDTHLHGMAFRLAFCLGLRQAEVLGLQWSDLDPERGVLLIRGTKTRGSHAALPLGPELSDLLRQHRVEQRRLWGDRVHICLGRRGQPVKSLNESLTRLLRQLGLPHYRLHDLRHTFATTLARSGQHPNVAQKLMRHSNVRTTLAYYTHLDEDHLKAAMFGVDQLLQP